MRIRDGRFLGAEKSVRRGSTADANNLAHMAGAGDVQGTSAFHAFAQSDQGVSDLETLGENQSTALGVNTPGQLVGFSTVADGSVHAFLYSDGKMFDLNTLCDLATKDFRILTVAKAINDSLVVVGEGITSGGAKHAFMLTPMPVKGGQWSHISGQFCCENERAQWVWIPNQRRLVVGIQLRLLPLARTARQSAALSAGTAPLLVVSLLADGPCLISAFHGAGP